MTITYEDLAAASGTFELTDAEFDDLSDVRS